MVVVGVVGIEVEVESLEVDVDRLSTHLNATMKQRRKKVVDIVILDLDENNILLDKIMTGTTTIIITGDR